MRDEQSGKTTSRSLSYHLPQTVIASPKNQTSSRSRSISDVGKELNRVSFKHLITFHPKGHGSSSYSHSNDDEIDDENGQLIPMGTSSYNNAARGITNSAVEELSDNRSGGSSADSWTDEDYKNFGTPADRDHKGSIGDKNLFKSGNAVFASLIHTPLIGAKPVKKGDRKDGEEEDGEEDETEFDNENEEDSEEVSTAATEPVAPPATVTGGTSATRRGSRTVGTAVPTTTLGAPAVVPSTPADKSAAILNKNGYNNIVPLKMIPVVVPAGTTLRCIWCGKRGHCPNGTCSVCGEKGHTSFRCPRGL